MTTFSHAHQPLAGIRMLAFVGDAYEDLELWYPKLRIEEAGGHVTVAVDERAAKLDLLRHDNTPRSCPSPTAAADSRFLRTCAQPEPA